jgi:hypothetical protein
MDINLNLPTLPTTNQKNALDGANSPSTSNVFITANDLALKVPYTGATSDVNLGEFGIQLGNLEFDTTPTNVPTGAGSLNWNDTDGTLDLKLKGGNVTLQIGQEQLTRVVNKTATNITLLEANYQAVRITGAQGQRLKVDLALATTDALSTETIGLVTETIANNQEGFITTSGLIRGINTTGSLQSETWADGDILYLSGTTAGNITNVKPTAPIHLIVIGYVVYSHGVNGSIYVKVDNGYELEELHNVLITTPVNNDLLAYESSTSLWKNKSASDLNLGATVFFAHAATSPADSTTYFVGGLIAVIPTITSQSRFRIESPITGTFDRLRVVQQMGLGTTENATIKLNNKTAGTSVTLSSTFQYDNVVKLYTSIGLAVTIGDELEIEINTPIWVTNPTVVQQYFYGYIKQ